MKTACVLITHLPAKAELRRCPELCSKPVIIVAQSGRGPLVLDSTPEVRGVAAGMPLQEALSRCKGAALLEADEPYYHKVFERVLDSLLERSPVVEKAGIGCAYVGVSGLEAMYGGEPRIVAALLSAAPPQFNARIGLAETRFPAYVAAVTSQGGRATKVPDDVAGFLAELSIDLLPVSWDSRVRLRRFGLRTVGQIASLPVGPLQAQLGTEGRLAWELANGIDRSWPAPYRQSQTVSELLSFPSPAVTLQAILAAMETLLGRAFSHPLVRGKYVRSVIIEAQVWRRAPWVRTFVFKEAVNGKGRALMALSSMMEPVRIPGPLEDMKLTLSGITGESGVQASLFSDVRKKEQLKDVMKQLEARLGSRPPIFKIVDVEPWSRLPERRQARVQFAP